MRVGVIGAPHQETNPQLVQAWRAAGIDARLMGPNEARWQLRSGDVALIRLDVLPTLDGDEPGLRLLAPLAARGVRVLNRPEALLAAHDKLETARRLRAAGIGQPRWAHATTPTAHLELSPPVVVKPRFGSWGRDVFLCEDERELRHCLAEVSARPWFVAHGAFVQELASRTRHDLRLVLAGGRVIGAGRRFAAPGEWRTNISLGGSLREATPNEQDVMLAVAATHAIGMSLAGVDILPLPGGGRVVLEVNGAVDFDDRYSLRGGDVYLDAAAALRLLPSVSGGDVPDLGVRESQQVACPDPHRLIV
jgi:RimK family alpha-L-glutamate ligase